MKIGPVLLSAGLLALLFVLSSGAAPRTAATRKPDSYCNLTKAGVTACLPCIVVGTPPAELPPANCCSALAGADLPCLCKFKGSSALRRAGIDPKLAMQLPRKCNLILPKACY